MISESEQASIQRNVDMDAKFFKKHLDRKERNNKTLKTNFLYLHKSFLFHDIPSRNKDVSSLVLISRLKEGHFDFLRRFRAFKQCAPFQLGCSLKSNNRRRIDGNPIKYCIVLHANEV